MQVPSIDSVTVLWPHRGPAATLVRRLKYRRHTSVVTSIADGLAPIVPPVDVITWCPASPDRRRRRGFDQSELLARAVGVRVGRPVRRLLTRSSGPAQTERSVVDRRRGPQLRARGRVSAGARVLLIDDVLTTGASASRAAEALRRAGAASVHLAVATNAERRSPDTVLSMGVPSRSTPD